MTLLKLFGSATSPFVRKVRILSGLVNFNDNPVIFSPASAAPYKHAGRGADNETIAQMNPLGKVPVLETDLQIGSVYDSKVICEFLNDHFKKSFYPKDQYFETRKAEALTDGVLEASVLIFYETTYRPEEKHHQPYVNGQWEKVTRGLDYLESVAKKLSTRREDLTIVEIGVESILGFLSFTQPQFGWEQKYPALKQWREEVLKIDAMHSTLPHK